MKVSTNNKAGILRQLYTQLSGSRCALARYWVKPVCQFSYSWLQVCNTTAGRWRRRCPLKNTPGSKHQRLLFGSFAHYCFNSCLLTGTSTYNTNITKSVVTTPNGYSYEFIVTATVHAMPTTIWTLYIIDHPRGRNFLIARTLVHSSMWQPRLSIEWSTTEKTFCKLAGILPPIRQGCHPYIISFVNDEIPIWIPKHIFARIMFAPAHSNVSAYECSFRGPIIFLLGPVTSLSQKWQQNTCITRRFSP